MSADPSVYFCKFLCACIIFLLPVRGFILSQPYERFVLPACTGRPSSLASPPRRPTYHPAAAPTTPPLYLPRRHPAPTPAYPRPPHAIRSLPVSAISASHPTTCWYTGPKIHYQPPSHSHPMYRATTSTSVTVCPNSLPTSHHHSRQRAPQRYDNGFSYHEKSTATPSAYLWCQHWIRGEQAKKTTMQQRG